MLLTALWHLFDTLFFRYLNPKRVFFFKFHFIDGIYWKGHKTFIQNHSLTYQKSLSTTSIIDCQLLGQISSVVKKWRLMFPEEWYFKNCSFWHFNLHFVLETTETPVFMLSLLRLWNCRTGNLKMNFAYKVMEYVDTIAESFDYVNYGSSIIASKISQIINLSN